MKFKKNWIKMTEDNKDQVEETAEEEKEETEMSFFSKHKKGLIIGGLGALAAGAVGILLTRKGSDDDYEDDFDDDDFDSEEGSEDTDSEESKES